jgi:hypothetical protein
MREETRRILELFVEKANELQFFFEHMQSVGIGFTGVRTSEGEWEIQFDLPEEQKKKSFILTFRFFYNQKESISILKLRRFLNDPELSDNWKMGVSNKRNAYIDYLKGYSAYTVELFDGHPTRAEILDTVINGVLAHADPEKLQRFKQWTRDDIRANLLDQEFATILVQIFRLNNYTKELREQELNSIHA